MGVIVEKAGLYTTIQDLGRNGYQRYGVPVSGAMDTWAFQLANLLVQNPLNTPSLEITLIGPTLRFTKTMYISVCGADLSPTLNNVPIRIGKRILIKKGDVLRFGKPLSGCRAYIAFSGGLLVPNTLNSSSTYSPSEIGGKDGRALVAGDELFIDSHPSQVLVHDSNWFLSPMLFQYNTNQVIRIVKGKQWDWFTEEAHRIITEQKFFIQPNSDRMGYRVTSDLKLTLTHSQELITEGTSIGTIQVPASGDPIILQADCQPTGGYPKIAHVISSDLRILAQKKPNEYIRFKIVERYEAMESLRNSHKQLNYVGKAIERKLLNQNL